MTLLCAICFYVPDEPHEAAEAVTVMRGFAVCEDHLGYVAQGTEWHAILSAAKRDAGDHSDGQEFAGAAGPTKQGPARPGDHSDGDPRV